jgi:predicted DNA-binding protein (MmcQ/YjbR family)
MATLKRAEAELLRFAAAYPGAYPDSPWGERVMKVNKKVFVFFHVPGPDLHVTVKLPSSATLALGLPFVKPTGYGLGKSGWVTATFGPKVPPPVEVLKQWIDESYKAVAPKKLLKRLEGVSAEPPKPRPKAKGLPRARR